MKRLFWFVPVMLYISLVLVSCSDVSDTPMNSMIFIPAGEYIRGSNNILNEMPESSVYVNNFHIDIYEVSNTQYRYFLQGTGYPAPSDWVDGNYEPGKGDDAVINVTLDDADAYCKWVGKRLPSEDEWEKAARGPNGNIYPWGNEQPDRTLANYNYYIGETTAIGDYPMGASYYGVYNMAGNVWEWTSSWYDAYEGNETDENPEYGTTYKVLRGGSWNSAPSLLISSTRGRRVPSEPMDALGFRCAK